MKDKLYEVRCCYCKKPFLVKEKDLVEAKQVKVMTTAELALTKKERENEKHLQDLHT